MVRTVVLEFVPDPDERPRQADPQGIVVTSAQGRGEHVRVASDFLPFPPPKFVLIEQPPFRFGKPVPDQRCQLEVGHDLAWRRSRIETLPAIGDGAFIPALAAGLGHQLVEGHLLNLSPDVILRLLTGPSRASFSKESEEDRLANIE